MADFLDSNPKSGEAKSEQEANKNASGTTSSATNDYAQNRTIGVNTSSNKADDCSDLTDVNQQEDDNAAPKSFPQRVSYAPKRRIVSKEVAGISNPAYLFQKDMSCDCPNCNYLEQ